MKFNFIFLRALIQEGLTLLYIEIIVQRDNKLVEAGNILYIFLDINILNLSIICATFSPTFV